MLYSLWFGRKFATAVGEKSEWERMMTHAGEDSIFRVGDAQFFSPLLTHTHTHLPPFFFSFSEISNVRAYRPGSSFSSSSFEWRCRRPKTACLMQLEFVSSLSLSLSLSSQDIITIKDRNNQGHDKCCKTFFLNLSFIPFFFLSPLPLLPLVSSRAKLSTLSLE